MPRTEEARPRRLGPAGVGDAPVDVARLEVEPEFAGKLVAEAVADLRVQHHLRRAGGGAGEINDAGLVAAGRLTREGCRRLQPAGFVGSQEDSIEVFHLTGAVSIRA